VSISRRAGSIGVIPESEFIAVDVERRAFDVTPAILLL
jgi:hypothetical protein